MPSTEAAPDQPLFNSAHEAELAGLLEQAMEAHRNNQNQQALEAYERLLAKAPDHPDGLHLLGVLEAQLRHPERALELIGRAVALKPHEPMFHNNLGNVCAEADRLEEAESHYRRAIEIDPTRYDALNNVAVLQGRRGDSENAEATFKALLEIAPGFADARQNLANLYLRMGRVGDAIEQCALGLVTSPRNRGMRRLLGSAYGSMGLREEALELYKQWLAEDPESAEAQHHVAAYTGERVPDRASDRYVRAMFDTFANSFDAKLADLDYRAPTLVGELVAKELGEPEGVLSVADAGCGTGLCAKFLRPYARRLVGIDLSVPMLEKARARNLYDALSDAELTAFFQANPAEFDLLVSADTLCYFGRLQDFAHAAFASLKRGGLLVFTVEAHGGDVAESGWRLQTHGRYSHRKEYVQACLADAGFEGVNLESVVLRQEALKPVQGWLVHANRP